MDSFEQNASVKVNELQAVYNDMQRRYNDLESKFQNLTVSFKDAENTLNHFIDELNILKNNLNSKSLWRIIINKLCKKPIC